MVSEEGASLGEAHGVDAVWFKGFDCSVGDGADNEEGEEEVVAAG